MPNNSKNQLTEKPLTANNLWHNFFIRSANALIFDLNDQIKNINQFSCEELLILAAICDNISTKGKIFKEELERRINKN